MINMRCSPTQYLKQKKKAIEFKDKQKSMRKKHDCRVVEFDYKYFRWSR